MASSSSKGHPSARKSSAASSRRRDGSGDGSETLALLEHFKGLGETGLSFSEKDHCFHCRKQLAYLLRHGASDHRIPMDSSGFVAVGDFLHFSRRYSLEQLVQCVVTDQKARFQFSPDGSMVRACQGHSLAALDDDLLMTRLTPETALSIKRCVHSTPLEDWKKIKDQGEVVPSCMIKDHPANRTHVHFATLEPRSGPNVDLHLNIYNWVCGGGVAFLSANDVVCIPEKIPVGFFSRIVMPRLLRPVPVSGRRRRSRTPRESFVSEDPSEAVTMRETRALTWRRPPTLRTPSDVPPWRSSSRPGGGLRLSSRPWHQVMGGGESGE